MKKIYADRVPTVPLTPTTVHRALSYLIDHQTHATRYLVITPDGRMA
jgi:hypothetical protein